MLKCPILYFQDNLVFGKDKTCWAIYEATGFDYDLLSNEAKNGILHKLTRFISSINVEAKLLIVPVKQNAKEHFENLRQRPISDEELKETKNNLLTMTENYLLSSLENTGNINDYRTYVVVKMATSTEFPALAKAKEIYEYFIKQPINALNVFMNLGQNGMLQSKIDFYKKMAHKFASDNQNRMSLQEISTATTQWLLRRPAFRGLEKDVKLFYKSSNEEWRPYSLSININQEKILKPYYRDTINLFSGVIHQENRHLKIEHDGQSSYQTFLSINNIPEIMEFPSCEWIYMLQRNNSQSEICIHFKNVEHRESLRMIELKKREANSQIENILSANADIPTDLHEMKEESDTLEIELKAGRLPLCQVSVTICVSSDNKDDMEKKADLIKMMYEDLNFSIERSYADQLKLYMSFFPSTGHATKDYIMRLTPQSLSSGIFGATNVLGDTVGYYIGTTGLSAKHVYLDLSLAPRLNKSAAATFFGNLGYGKSFNANLLVYLNFIDGGYSLVFDPKGERSHWADFPLFKKHINVVTLIPDRKFEGMLDPYNIYHDSIEEANNLAMNIICELFEITSQNNEYIVLMEAQSKLSENYKNNSTKPSMQELYNVINDFEASDNLKNSATNLARRINAMRKSSLSALLFGNGTESSIKLDNRINLLQIQNLTLPSAETAKSDYTNEEKLSTVLMIVMANFAKRFALEPRKSFSLILFDESWALGKTTEGVKLYDFLSRMGRSLYTGCIFNGHSVLDIPTEGIKNTITYKFCFNTQNKEEAKRMLEYLGLEITIANIDLVQNLGNGQCLFQDAFRRVGILTFDAVFTDVISLFSTTPTADKGNATRVKESEEIEEIEEIDASEIQGIQKEGSGTRTKANDIDIANIKNMINDFNFEDLEIYEKAR
ncbi:MAG: ATP-binding protein [Defluviitaleaceae bacterium]|nr:ATP-binding protein [Defluviitaleaceae bacterium]